jgi:hypothetical protein
MTLRPTVRFTTRVDPNVLRLQEMMRRLSMRLREPLSSPEEMDAMLAAYHGVNR